MAAKHPSLKATVRPLGGTPPWFSVALHRAGGFFGALEWALRDECEALGRALTTRDIPFNTHAAAGVIFVGTEREQIEGLLAERGLV